MISKPKGAHRMRWASGALILGTTAALIAAPLVGTASAAPATTPATSVTIGTSSQNQNIATSNNATIAGSFAPSSSDATIEWTIVSGTGASGGLAGTSCTKTAPNYSCTVTDPGAGSSDVRIFADNDGSNTFTAGDVFADTTVTWSGPVATISLTPDAPTVPAGNCEVYTAVANDTGGRPAASRTITETATEGTTGSPLQFCSTTSGAGLGSANFTISATASTDSTGTVKFGVMSSTAGAVSVEASVGTPPAPINDISSETVTAGGAAAVTKLVASPTAPAGYTGSSNTYTVTATDTNGNPVQGVQVQYQIVSSTTTDATTVGTYPNCGSTTGPNGQATCTLTNGGTAGSDTITFFVNETSGSGTHTAGPDAGEPQATATATFTAPPTISAITVTCPTPGGAASAACDVPVDQHAVTYTATVVNGSTPVSGAVVSFAATGSPVTAGTATPASGTATTNASGVATFTVTNATPSNNDNVVVTATVTSHNGSANATWQTRVASAFTLTPPLQTVTNGGSVTVTATVVDQFGTGVSGQSILYTVTGRNAGKTGSVTTGSTGTAAITYTDAGTAGSTDTITANDVTTGSLGTQNATIDYIAGSTSPSAVTIDTSGLGSAATCPPTSGASTAQTGAALGSTSEVCAVVKNSTGTVLAGSPVTFTVTTGVVDAHGGISSTSTQTFTTSTNGSGIAVADVSSHKSGVQSVTATAGTAKATGTITYNAPVAGAARNVALTPATANAVSPGNSQPFTATVTDGYGNGVPGVTVTFSKSGPGNFGAVSSVQATTNGAGVAIATLSTAASDSGSGSVTADITNGGANQCTDAAASPTASFTAGNCTATSTYTVTSVHVSSLTLKAATGTKAGGTEKVTATVKNSDGTPAANVVVRYTVSGANSASGGATTNSSGVATLSYKASAAGKDTITAYADVNDDQVKQSGEPGGTAHATISKIVEKPTVSLSSKSKGHLTVKVTTKPKLSGKSVHFYSVSKSGHRTLLGSASSGSGSVSKTFKLTAGKTYKIEVKVIGLSSAKYTSKYSAAHSKKVK